MSPCVALPTRKELKLIGKQSVDIVAGRDDRPKLTPACRRDAKKGSASVRPSRASNRLFSACTLHLRASMGARRAGNATGRQMPQQLVIHKSVSRPVGVVPASFLPPVNILQAQADCPDAKFAVALGSEESADARNLTPYFVQSRLDCGTLSCSR
jgi:hypothetical protein